MPSASTSAQERFAQVGFQRRARAEMVIERLDGDRTGVALAIDGR